MSRTVFWIAVAGFIVAAVPSTVQSAPLAPLPSGITAYFADDLMDVSWRRCWRDAGGACIVVVAGVAPGDAYAAGDFGSPIAL